MVCSLCGIKGHNKRTCKNKDPIKDILHGIIGKVITLNKELNEVEKLFSSKSQWEKFCLLRYEKKNTFNSKS